MSGKILRDDVLEYQKIVDGLTVVTGKLDELGKSIVEIKKAGGTFSFDNLVSSNKKIEQSQSSLKKIEEERIRIQKEIEKVFIKNLAAEEKNYKVLIKGREALKQKNAALREEVTGQKAAAKARREAAAAEKQQAAMTKLLIAARNTESGSLSRLNALNNIYKARMKELNVLIPAQAKTYDFLNKKILMNQKAMANMAMGAQKGTKQFNMLQWQIMQVSREMPAFAYGINVGIGALSNNLPMLADEINNVRKANAALIKQGKPVTSVFKQIVTSILSWQTALVAAVTLLTIYGEDIADWITKLKNGKNATDKLVDSTKQLNEAFSEGAKNSQEEITKLRVLYKASQDLTKPYEERVSAVEEMQRIYPEYLGNFTKESVLAGDAYSAYTALNDSIQNRSRSLAVFGKMVANNTKSIEKEIEAGKIWAAIQSEEDKRDALMARKAAGGFSDASEIDRVIDGINEQNRRINNLRAAWGEINNEVISYREANEDLMKFVDTGSLFGATRKTSSADKKEKEDDYNFDLDLYLSNYQSKLTASRNNEEELVRIRREFLWEQLNNEKLFGELTLEERARLYDEWIRTYDEMSQIYSDNVISSILETSDREKLAIASKLNEQLRLYKRNGEKREDLMMESSINLLEIDLKAQEEIIKSAVTTEDAKTDAKKKAAEIRQAIDDAETDREIKNYETRVEKFQETTKAIGDIANAGFEFNAALNDRALANAERRYELEVAAAGDNIFKRTAAENKFADEKAEIEHRQAVADKANAAFNIILQTSKWIAEYGFFTPQAILASVLGGIQLATVLAEPIPTYAEGVEGHPGGLALVGDKKGNPKVAGGSELGVLPSGKTFLTPDTPTIMDLPKGTDIIPHDETTKLLAAQAISKSHDMIDMSGTNSHLRRIEKNTGESVHYEGGYKIVRKKGFIGRYR